MNMSSPIPNTAMTKPLIIDTPQKWYDIKTSFKQGTRIGFVPTMGNLHEGHLSLIRKSTRENDITVLSIFINPTQFNDQHDFNNYPKTFEQDVILAETVGVDYIFAPHTATLYPDNYLFQIATNHPFAKIMEGKFRPGHFEGMLTIVLKLLLIIDGNQAYFGEKDFQQLVLVDHLTKAFCLPTHIIACPTLRDHDGLALSSRNQLLTPQDRKLAPFFYHTLKESPSASVAAETLREKGFLVDYIEDHNKRRFGAVKLGHVRLIDNILL